MVALVSLPVAAMLRETIVYLRRHLTLEPWTVGGHEPPLALLGGASPEAGNSSPAPASASPGAGSASLERPPPQTPADRSGSVGRPESRSAGFFARISPRLAGRPGSARVTRAHAALLRRSGGRLGKRFLGAEVLVLRTRGRRSGKKRDAPVFFVSHGDAFAVVASNGASPKPPAWWLNLQSEPEADALVQGSWRPVRGRRATEAEAEALWPRLVEVYRGYEQYRAIATRELPVVVLEPLADEE